MDVTIPSQEQLVEMVNVRLEHEKTCNYVPYYDLSHYTLTIRCQCGWVHTLENDND